jgi:signal transduction histidine kinase
MVPIGLSVAVAVLLAKAPTVKLLLSWRGAGRTRDRAPAVWNTAVRMPWFGVVWGCQSGIVAGPTTVGIFLLVTGKSLLTGLGMLIAGVLGGLAGLVAIAFLMELGLRPMLEDVARCLPPEFEPGARAWRLQAKALAPLPLVTLFSALAVGAYVDLVARGFFRLILAVGIALATIAVAGFVFWVVNRSLLDPLDDLLAATRRVAEGDITTPVARVTADELGALASGFNRMLGQLRRHEQDLHESRARIVVAADEARRRVERDLHDGAQQHLVLLNLKLGLLVRRIADDAETVKLVEELREDLHRAQTELRALAHGIYPQVLSSDGLGAALREAAATAAIPTEASVDGIGRHRPELEAAVYFCCLEALQNAAKHAGEGATARILLSENDGAFRFEVVDTGAGFDAAAAAESSGLQGMTDRIGAIGGELSVHSDPTRGTRVTGSVPVG